MSKARTLAGVVSTGAVLADGTIDAAEIGNLTLPTGGDIVGTTATQTLTNKTIAYADNTLTGVVGTTATQTLTNKTIDIASNTLTGVQPTLVSGTNIKTIGGQSVMGSGDLEVGGGSMVFLSSATASSSATVSLETGFGSTYDAYMVVLSAVKVESDGTVLGMRLRIGGSYLSGSNYNSFSMQGYSYVATFTGVADDGNTRVRLTTDQGADSGETANLVIYFGPTSDSTNYKQFYWTGAFSSSDGSAGQIVRNTHGGGAVRASTAALTGVRFAADSGNIASGTFRLYGIKNS